MIRRNGTARRKTTAKWSECIKERVNDLGLRPGVQHAYELATHIVLEAAAGGEQTRTTAN